MRRNGRVSSLNNGRIPGDGVHLSPICRVAVALLSCQNAVFSVTLGAPFATGGFEMSVQKFRLKLGWSQQQLADASGLSVRTIQRIEAGYPASTESLKSLAAVFEVDFSSLNPEQTMSTATTATTETTTTTASS
ncbi:MAG: helix-turn-helix transcriptional regulator, partial [Burkholderiales bacterium]